jgi:hypothetical protein
MSEKNATLENTTANANSGCLRRMVRKCGKCKHAGPHFRIANLGTHMHCCHPDKSVSGEPGWDTLREWYGSCEHFIPNSRRDARREMDKQS